MARELLLAIVLALAAACALDRARIGFRSSQRANAEGFLARAMPAKAVPSRRLSGRSLQLLATAQSLPQHFVAAYEQEFQVFDKDRDGTISASEIDTQSCAVGGILNDTYDQVDVDGDGAIRFHEFLHFLRLRVGWTPKASEASGQELTEACAVFDRDHNGFICAAELGRVSRDLGQSLTDQEIEEAMREADANGDSKVSYEEFVARFTAPADQR